MERISLDPPRTLSYRIGEWYLRRQFGEVLDPFRAQGHNMPVAQAIGRLEQSAAKWKKVDLKIRDLADLAAAVKIGCPWCMDFGYWILHGHGMSPEKLEAVPNWRCPPTWCPRPPNSRPPGRRGSGPVYASRAAEERNPPRHV